jgi:hypothetical protein
VHEELGKDCTNHAFLFLCAPNSFKSKSQDRSSLTHLISEIKVLVSGSRFISFVKVDRTQNRDSHCLVNFSRAEGRTDTWCGSGLLTVWFKCLIMTVL